MSGRDRYGDPPLGDERYDDDRLDAGGAYADDDYDDTGKWVTYKQPTSTLRRVIVALVVVLGVLVVTLGGAYVFLQRQIDPPGGPGEAVELEVAAGATTEDIGRQLEEAGVITSAAIWDYWTRFKGEGPFQAGAYTFRLDSSFDDAVEVLEAGPRPPENPRVTVPEGLTLAEIVTRLVDPEQGVEGFDRNEVLQALTSGAVRSRYQPPDVTSMEGLLFPDTYEIADGETEATLLARFVAQLDATMDELGATERAAALGRTPYEIIVIASLIEEEARVPEERVKISRVIHNRLAQGIPLGIDATSRYEAEIQGRSRDDIDFSSDSPYNTRRVAGLPPTPIAAAGRAAIDAALNPTEGDWIFYVLADEQGHHFFTASAREFERAKAECKRKGLGCG